MSQHELPPVFYEVFDASLPRLGPGDDASTLKALGLLAAIRAEGEGAPGPADLRILDIGCGNGAQTLQLARHAGGTITAVDNHRPFLDELQRRAAAEGLSERIQPCLGDMRALEMAEGYFDLIWSEGALFIMGFREGLEAFHPLLAPGGQVAVSDLFWLLPDPPAECSEWLAATCPGVMDVAAGLATIRACGYEDLGHFVLPESAWWDAFYHPLEARLASLRQKYAADADEMGMIEAIEQEIEMYRKYSRYYGYVFYLMRKA